MTYSPIERTNGAGNPAGNPDFMVKDIAIEREMSSAYLAYAMSVIVSRAIPDLRDGLKPVHRRILHSMNESGNSSDKPYRKSARPVGDVMGKYHPHGDNAIYDALVRMAQDFSMSIPLLDGQGNFGSMDGDNPAAMRYTEVRMAKVAEVLLADIDRETVDFQDNYDGKDREPVVLPARFPNLFVNGSGGIAVGMATNIPPHNLGELVDAALAMIEEPDISVERLMEHVPAPDFPTGGIIYGKIGCAKAYLTGRGAIKVRAKTRIETLRNDREAIIIDEIPYQVNKALLVERIAEVAKQKKIEGIAHVQDESDRKGVRVVIEVKRDASPRVVLNQLWRFTSMEIAFHCNLLALNGGRPEQLTLVRYLSSFIEFRTDVVARRTEYNLRRARERSHILCGLAVAVSNLDEVIGIIRSSAQPAQARAQLMERRWPAAQIAEYIRLIDDPSHTVSEDETYMLSEIQARAILELRLQRLTAMGVKENTDELEKLAAEIKDFLDILQSGRRIREIISDELKEVKRLFAVPRRTEIVDDPEEVEDEDLIESEDVVVTITEAGYIKRTNLDEFRAQQRGGKGQSGMATKDDDIIKSMHVLNTHDPLVVFMTDGMAYSLKTWRIPKGGRNARGKAIINLLPNTQGASVAAILPISQSDNDPDQTQIVFATSAGKIRRNRLGDFTRIFSNGKRAILLPENSTLVNARICTDTDDIILVTTKGYAARFPANTVRVFKDRKSNGVRGIKVTSGDKVVAMEVVPSFAASSDERIAYLKMRRAESASMQDELPHISDELGILEAEQPAETEETEITLPAERYEEMKNADVTLLTITAGGLGKRSSLHDYIARENRGGKGVVAIRLKPDDNPDDVGIVGFLAAAEDDQIMLTTNSGKSIRCNVSEISFLSRTARGVRIMRLEKDQRIVSVARMDSDEEDDHSGESATSEPE